MPAVPRAEGQRRSAWGRIILLGGLLWLTGCASQVRNIDAHCLAMGDARLAGQFALVVEHEQSTYQLLVVNQWRDQQLQFVGFNAVGAKLFQGQLDRGQISADSIRLYRGPDAQSLLWGLLMHQLREQLPDCWPPGQLEVQGETVSLQQKGRIIFSSVAKNQFVLPPRDIRVRVERLN